MIDPGHRGCRFSAFVWGGRFGAFVGGGARSRSANSRSISPISFT